MSNVRICTTGVFRPCSFVLGSLSLESVVPRGFRLQNNINAQGMLEKAHQSSINHPLAEESPINVGHGFAEKTRFESRYGTDLYGLPIFPRNGSDLVPRILKTVGSRCLPVKTELPAVLHLSSLTIKTL